MAQTERSVAEGGTRCPVPAVGTEYDVHELVVHISLPVSGCAARQHRVIEMDTTLRRVEDDESGDGLGGGVTCGPYPSAGDTDAADPAEEESCGEGMGLDHPPVEAARYEIDITYPGASGKRTVTDAIFCRSDGENVSCDPLAMGAERDAGS
jgi:hypothetical protein